MAPAASPRFRWSSGFPRPRGDGPSARLPTILATLVPPPARGWPFRSILKSLGLTGSSARAGMAPRRSCHSRPRPRFPRPRGDDPSPARSWGLGRWVPPPARGWPRTAQILRLRGDGSPDRAGMAPRLDVRFCALPRFPRPRGDGPVWPPLHQLASEVPPPAGGWPPEDPPPPPNAPGSPARAGMAPIRAATEHQRSGFPRPRGDGPCIDLEGPDTGVVPPPARGWPRR